MSTPRDTTAGLKMYGALLRLEALYPGGFNKRQLAEIARVGEQTAHDFLKPDRRPAYVEPVPPMALERNSAGGRPLNLFRISASGKRDLLRQVAEFRRSLDFEAGGPSVVPEEQRPTSLQLLQETLAQLESEEISSDDWREHLEEAKLEMAGCKADLRALQAAASPFARAYEAQLAIAEKRLKNVQGVNDPVVGPPMDLLGDLVQQFGSWVLGVPNGLEPLLVLLDGGQGHSEVVDKIIASCRAKGLHVALFPVGRMEKVDRVHLYSWLDCLRVVTPLAVCNFVLTVDSHMKLASELALEFRDFGEPGTWGEHHKVVDADIAQLNFDIVRRNYLQQCRPLLSPSETDSRRQTFAQLCTSALLTLETINAVEMRGASGFLGSVDKRRNRWLTAAHGLMGDVICLDSFYTSYLQQAFSGCPVNYFGRMANQDALNWNEIIG